MTSVRKPKYCCKDFNLSLLTNTREDENTHEVTQLDGWYIMGRPYDSWYGHFGKGKKLNFCPWCGKNLDHAPKDTNTVTYDGRSIDGTE